MLDAPVLVAGQLGGVLCIEHVGEPRQWTHGEQSLAISVTHLVSLALSQRALALSESRWRTIVESEPECVKIVSLDGKVLEMNPAGLRVIEADSLEQVLGRTVENLLHDEDLAAYQDLHLRACKGMTGQLEFRICGLRGAARWMETHSTPLRGADGAVSSVLSVTRDVTERKLAEQRLARLNRLYQMLSHTNEAIVRVAGRQGLYEAVCKIAVDHGRFRMAAIVGLDEGGSEVRPIAIAGEDAGYFSEISVVLTDTELNRGVIGTSLLTGRRDICNDFINDPRMARWPAAGVLFYGGIPDHVRPAGGRGLSAVLG
jgi:PAS domain S-box-containing protein